MTSLNDHKKLIWGTLTAFTVLYLVAFFPFAYFRHDDLLNLGNAILRLPLNWKSMFSATWIENGVEHIWFFRPLFKLSYYLGFKAFGYAYYAWLFSTFILTLFSIFLTFRTILLINGSMNAATFFLVLFAGCFHFHLGSLLWAGEGFMNVPSAFLLSLSAYSFTKYLQNEKLIQWQLLSLFSFVLALGYKEASFAHVVLLGGIYFTLFPRFQFFPKPLVPHMILTAAYLVFRLCYLPINPFYHPKIETGLRAFLYFVASFLFPYIWLRVSLGKNWTDFLNFKKFSSVCFLVFLIAVILPHQGHPFFSPGWLFYPGFFFCFILAVTVRSPESFKIKWVPCLLLCFFSLGGVVYKMQSIRWWQWGQAQKDMHRLLESISPDKPETVRVRDCSTESFRPERVLGHNGAISDWYEAIHGRRLNFRYVPCNTLLRYDPKAIWYDWKFPHLIKSTAFP